jgi:hypothetical protein
VKPGASEAPSAAVTSRAFLVNIPPGQAPLHAGDARAGLAVRSTHAADSGVR